MIRAADSPDERRFPRWPLIAILALALVLRLAWGLSRPADPESLLALPDQAEYHALARSLLDNGTLAFVDPRFGDRSFAFRMPGYPAFVAGFGANLPAVRVAQAILDASCVLATFWLARRWLSPRVACVAAAFVALDPIFVYFTGLILSETLFAALLTWGVACLAHGTSPMSISPGRRASVVRWLGVALLIASIYVRPSAIVLPTLLVAGSIFLETGSADFEPRRRRVPAVTLVALLTVVALTPWAIRNHGLLGRWIFTTTNDGFTLYDAWRPGAAGASDLASLKEMPLLSNLDEVQRSDYLRRLAFDALDADPARQLRLTAARLGRLWSPVPLSAEYGSRRAYVIGAAAHAVPLFALALVGLARSTAIGRRGKAFLLLPALAVTITYGLTVGSLRYRMPIHPTLAVLAASALATRQTQAE